MNKQAIIETLTALRDKIDDQAKKGSFDSHNYVGVWDSTLDAWARTLDAVLEAMQG